MDYKASKTQQKILDMMEYGYQAIRNFPKSERFSLAQDILFLTEIFMLLTKAMRRFII